MNAPSGNKEYNVKPVVIKRDGCQVPFDEARIAQAIERAALAVGVVDADYCATVARVVAQRMEQQPRVDIHEIQQAVENQLMAGEYKQLARAYIEYRHDRDVAREPRGRLNQEIRGLVEQSNRALLNENANKDSKVIPTQRDLLAGIVAKHYAKQHILPRDVVLAHERGEIHYHDLDYSPFFPMFNCMLIDLKGMLTNGFKMGNAEIEPPKSISTATAVTAQIIAQVASHIYGGTTINRIDEILAPFVDESFRKHLQVAEEWQIPDAKGYAMARTEKECYDAFQSLEYEVNTLHTANGQTPFVTFGFGLGTSWESRLIQRSILKTASPGWAKPQDRRVPQTGVRHPRRPQPPVRRSELRHQTAGAGVRQQAHVPGHPQLRSGGESHRLVQNADGLPQLPRHLRAGRRAGARRPQQHRRHQPQPAAHRAGGDGR